MAKKFISILVAVMLIVSMVAVAATTASAADGPSFKGGKVYWEIPEKWASAFAAEIKKGAVYCHVYSSKGDGLAEWQTKDEKMTEEDGKWVYDIPSGPYDQVIFSISGGPQTYDTVLTDACIGKTAKTDPDNMLQNPMDSNKTAAATTWDGVPTSEAGPHLGITSIGDLVGEVLCPTESGTDVVANFIINYLTTQEQYVTSDKLKTAMEKCNTDAQSVYSAVEANGSIAGVAVETEDGKKYDDALQLAKERLGITDDSGSDNNNNGDAASDNNNGGDNNANTDNGGNNNAAGGDSSTGGSRGSSTTSTTSSGTTTTGDNTPYVVLAAVLVAALGIAVVAAKKKVSE